MNARKLSASLEAACEYLRIAKAAAEDSEELSDDISNIIIRLRAIDPEAPRGPLTAAKVVQTPATKYAAAEARRLRNAHPEWTLRELGQQLHFLGFRARTGTIYSTQMVNHLLKQGR